MKITIKGRTREITALEFISACKRRGAAIKRDWFRLSCADERARTILDASPELEAAVLLELSKTDGEVRDFLMERAAILWAENCSHSAADAAKALIGR
jgi:hypothetical protein